LRVTAAPKNMLQLLASADGRPILFRKLMHRFETPWARARTQKARAYYSANASTYEPILRATQPDLWQETVEFTTSFRENALPTLRNCPVSFGGAGAIELLYFLVRIKSPTVVLETGVGAGWSSAVILHALDANEEGQLFSSDLPYIRCKHSRSYIGLLVEERLHPRWHLLDAGDRHNLPRLLEMMNERIDIFHYDSDKSYAGRAFAYNVISDYLASEAVVIFDDVQDNSHFLDLVRATGRPFHIFRHGRKYVGVTGLDRLVASKEQ
jgi:predicted O-methyltransferase YrrM